MGWNPVKLQQPASALLLNLGNCGPESFSQGISPPRILMCHRTRGVSSHSRGPHRTPHILTDLRTPQKAYYTRKTVAYSQKPFFWKNEPEEVFLFFFFGGKMLGNMIRRANYFRIFFLIRFRNYFWIPAFPASLLSCFSCFSAFLLFLLFCFSCFSPFLLFCFSASPASLLLCFSAFLLFCFSCFFASLLFLLLCFSAFPASLPFCCFAFVRFLFLRFSAFLLLCFFCFACFKYLIFM